MQATIVEPTTYFSTVRPPAGSSDSLENTRIYGPPLVSKFTNWPCEVDSIDLCERLPDMHLLEALCL